MTHGSLFAGIGGFDLGFERAGLETIWQVEIDDYCRKVLEKYFPNAERFKDIRECGAHNLGPVDIISGGFPCVDISNAGKQAGIEGERSGLWNEMLRIVCELQPSFVVVENVAALLGRGLGRVLGDLAESGYDAEWDCLPAAPFGAPHQRDRVFIVAYTRREQRELQPQRGTRIPYSAKPADDGEKESVADPAGERTRAIPAGQGAERQREADLDGCSEEMAYADGERLPRSRANRIFTQQSFIESCGQASEWWATEPDVGRVAHGIPARVDRLRGLGNAVVPQIAEWLARRIIAAEAVKR